jgi:oxygen-independent coproporphyrinogen-3 oxidase
LEWGLLDINDNGIKVTPNGWYLIRAIAMVFDRYVQADSKRARFSRII